MKKRNQSDKTSFPLLPTVVLAAALLTAPAILLAEPDERKSPDRLAKKIREDLTENEAALQDLIRRAMENGGQLQLDVDEFEKLLRSPMPEKNKGKTQKELEEFLEKFGKDADDSDRRSGGGERGDAIKNFMEMFQRQMSQRKIGKNEKEHGSVLAEYRPVVERARASTVALLDGRKPVALGTVVDPDGYVITKASEVSGENLRCVVQGGDNVGAQVVDVYEPLDIALVKVKTGGLKPAVWGRSKDVELGTFLASPGIGEDPIAIGVASVAPRSLSEKTKGFLGVTPEGAGDGVRIGSVLRGTPAAKAGLRAGDVVLKVNNSEVTNRAAFHRLVAGFSPGEKVKFRIRRGDEEKTLTAKLVSREEFVGGGRTDPRIERMNLLGGKLSATRGGFASALQTDLTLGPEECGGPVVNLDGKVVGVNIARGGRVKSYAVPAEDLQALLGDVKSGRFTITDLALLKERATAAAETLKKAEAALEAARKAKQDADRALESAREG